MVSTFPTYEDKPGDQAYEDLEVTKTVVRKEKGKSRERQERGLCGPVDKEDEVC